MLSVQIMLFHGLIGQKMFWGLYHKSINFVRIKILYTLRQNAQHLHWGGTHLKGTNIRDASIQYLLSVSLQYWNFLPDRYRSDETYPNPILCEYCSVLLKVKVQVF